MLICRSSVVQRKCSDFENRVARFKYSIRSENDPISCHEFPTLENTPVESFHVSCRLFS